MFGMVHMVGVNPLWRFTQKNVQTKWSLSQESMAKNNEANQRCQLKGPSTVDDAAIREKMWPSRKWAKIDLQTTWWKWIWLPKRFHPSKCEKYSENPQERRRPWRKTPNNNKKSKTPMGLIGSSILKRIFFWFWMFNDFRTKPRLALRVLPALRFLRVRLCRDQGQRCQDLLDQRRWGENLNFPWWWEHPPVTKWIFN